MIDNYEEKYAVIDSNSKPQIIAAEIDKAAL